MKVTRTLPLIASFVVLAGSAPAIQLGKAAPAIVVSRPVPTEIVVYDARPELGLAIDDLSKKSRETLSELGIRLVRRTLFWNKMETTDKPGLYDSKYLAEWDALIDSCRSDGTCLVVTIDGDPPGVDARNRAAAYERLAGFAADMAARYPSVVYWCVPGGAGSTSQLLDGADVAENGKSCAEMLRAVTPGIRAANPAAWLLCPTPADSPDFLRSVYQAGGKPYLDIVDCRILAQPSPTSLEETAKAFRSIASEFGDEGRLFWGTRIASGPLVPSSNEEWFAKNNELKLFQKVFLQMGPESGALAKWLGDSAPNQVLFRTTRTPASVFVPSKVPVVPVGYDLKLVNDGIEIQRVLVDTLVPTRVRLMYAAEPAPPKPGEKPSPKPKKGTRPIPDPFDI